MPQCSWKRAKLELTEKHAIFEKSNNSNDFICEVERYMASEVSATDCIDILNCWKLTGTKLYHRLSQIARLVLSIPATAAPIERVWSVAGMIMNQKRSALRPDRLNKLVFIHGFVMILLKAI